VFLVRICCVQIQRVHVVALFASHTEAASDPRCFFLKATALV
jgi:hypothetical protein